MSNDFYIAFLTGWSVLFIFWSTIMIFVYIRKPLHSRLSSKIVIQSYLILLLLLLIIMISKYFDSFFKF